MDRLLEAVGQVNKNVTTSNDENARQLRALEERIAKLESEGNAHANRADNADSAVGQDQLQDRGRIGILAQLHLDEGALIEEMAQRLGMLEAQRQPQLTYGTAAQAGFPNQIEYPQRQLLTDPQPQQQTPHFASSNLPGIPASSFTTPMTASAEGSFEARMQQLVQGITQERQAWASLKGKLERTFEEHQPNLQVSVNQCMEQMEKSLMAGYSIKDYEIVRATMYHLVHQKGLIKAIGVKVNEIDDEIDCVWSLLAVLIDQTAPDDVREADRLETGFQGSQAKARNVLDNAYPAALGEVVRQFKSAYLALFRFLRARWNTTTQTTFLTIWQTPHDHLVCMLDLQQPGREQFQHLPTMNDVSQATTAQTALAIAGPISTKMHIDTA